MSGASVFFGTVKPPLEVPVMLSPVFGSKKGPFFISAHAGREQTSGKQLLVSIPLHEKLNNGIVTRLPRPLLEQIVLLLSGCKCLVSRPGALRAPGLFYFLYFD